MSTELPQLTEAQTFENKKSLSKEAANILLNIPSNLRDFVTEQIPPELFGTLCAFYDSKTVKSKIEFYMANPDKQF